ncbi:MAG TPA: hypothetical protein VER96_14515 [Polyangiaceae bacterium]|nr:hypothetical protein [Polyangiaceae bacterium]
MSRPRLVCLALSWLYFGLAAPPAQATEAVAPTTDSAAPDSPPERRFHADLELDPTAYVLDGFSLHVGLGWDALRIDLGVFGLAVPEFVHRQRDFDVAFDGYGVKAQYFPFAKQRGLFVGVDAAYSRALIRLRGSELAARDNQLALGMNAGVRCYVAGDFYITPWLGVGHSFGADDVSLGGKTFAANPLLIFPAVHLGYRLR